MRPRGLLGSIWDGVGGVLGRVWEAKMAKKNRVFAIFLDTLFEILILVTFVRFLITSMGGW